MSIYDKDAKFEVICKRCQKRFWVFRNFGGGTRRANDENINPAKCECGSLALEIF